MPHMDAPCLPRLSPSRKGEDGGLQHGGRDVLVDDAPEIEEARKRETGGLRLVTVHVVLEPEPAQQPSHLEEGVAAVQRGEDVHLVAGTLGHATNDRGMVAVRDQARDDAEIAQDVRGPQAEVAPRLDDAATSGEEMLRV